MALPDDRMGRDPGFFPPERELARANGLFAQGVARYDAGDQDGAATLCVQALEIDPDLVPALGMLFGIRFAQQAYAAAARVLERLLLLEPDTEQGFLFLAECYLQLGQAPDALEAIRVQPTRTLPYQYLTELYFAREQFTEALETLQELLAQQPDSHTTLFAHYNRGIALYSLERIKEAETAFQAALALEPTFALGHLQLGVVLVSQRRYREAMPHFRTVIQFMPDSAEGYAGLGQAHLGLGLFADAIEAFMQALTCEPNDLFARLNLVEAFLGAGRDDAACEEVRVIARLDPDTARQVVVLHPHLAISGDEEQRRAS